MIHTGNFEVDVLVQQRNRNLGKSSVVFVCIFRIGIRIDTIDRNHPQLESTQ